jgi:hypothetical protein
MPLLARMIAAPLFIDVRSGAIAGLGELLADRRIATEGRVAVAVGPGQGDSIASELSLDGAELFRVEDNSVDGAVRLGKRLRAGSYEAVAGIGDVISNLSALADWELAARENGERMDGLAVTLARTAAEAVLHQPGTVGSDQFVTVLAEALVLSGMAMAVSGDSRPCSGGDHEILHAIDQLYPGVGNHGELAGVGALFCAHLRGDARQAELMSACLARHELPRVPAELGLSVAEFTKAVVHAPATRPGRYTILEHLGLSEAAASERVEEYVRAVTG